MHNNYSDVRPQAPLGVCIPRTVLVDWITELDLIYHNNYSDVRPQAPLGVCIHRTGLDYWTGLLNFTGILHMLSAIFDHMVILFWFLV